MMATNSKVTIPKRIQRKRTKGWTKPEGAVNVARPSKWGNPHGWKENLAELSRRVETGEIKSPNGTGKPSQTELIKIAKRAASLEFAASLTNDQREEIRRELKGKDLMCWCRLDEPCHADELLRIANFSCSKPCSPSDYQPGGKCDQNGCYEH